VKGKIQAQDFVGMEGVEVDGQTVKARTQRLGPTTMQLIERVRKNPERSIEDIQVSRGNLEEVFIKVTGRTMEQEAGNAEEKHPEEIVAS
jgi:hypothetical protein